VQRLTKRRSIKRIFRPFSIPTRYAGAIPTWRSTPSLRASGFEDEDDDEDEAPCEGGGYKTKGLSSSPVTFAKRWAKKSSSLSLKWRPNKLTIKFR